MSKIIKTIDKYRFNTFTEDNTEETIEISGELISHTEYDLQGNITLSITYDNSGNIAEHIAYNYEGANLIEELIYDADEIV
jgi:hypothetical protein